MGKQCPLFIRPSIKGNTDIFNIAPTGAPRDVTVLTTSRSVSVSWDAIECIERNGMITGYAVEFQEEGGAMISGEVVGQIFTARELTPHTNYTFIVAGVNSNGTGLFTDVATILTDEDGTYVYNNKLVACIKKSIMQLLYSGNS